MTGAGTFFSSEKSTGFSSAYLNFLVGPFSRVGNQIQMFWTQPAKICGFHWLDNFQVKCIERLWKTLKYESPTPFFCASQQVKPCAVRNRHCAASILPIKILLNHCLGMHGFTATAAGQRWAGDGVKGLTYLFTLQKNWWISWCSTCSGFCKIDQYNLPKIQGN